MKKNNIKVNILKIKSITELKMLSVLHSLIEPIIKARSNWISNLVPNWKSRRLMDRNS